VGGARSRRSGGVVAAECVRVYRWPMSADPILALVPADRRGTLIAHKHPGSGPAIYRFDIRVQGENETVFFDI